MSCCGPYRAGDALTARPTGEARPTCIACVGSSVGGSASAPWLLFEIGIASDPHHRYHNDEHGYKHEGIWHFMEVMARDSAQECCMLERWLIHTLKAFPGCQNIRAGGDGVRADRTHTCFVYMVVAAAGTGRSLASARGARMIAQRARKMHFRLAGGS